VHLAHHDVRDGKTFRQLAGFPARRFLYTSAMLTRTKLALTPILIAVVSLTAVACGLKGPLYRSDETKNESVAPADPAATPKKKDTSSSTPPGEQSEPSVAPPDPDRPAVPPPGR
jgi:predicted small lipoprotein YifL